MLPTSVQVRATVVVDDALGVAGRARRIVERDRLPFVHGQHGRQAEIGALEQGGIGRLAQQLVRTRMLRIDDVDNAYGPRHLGQRLPDHRRVLGVGQQNVSLAVLQDEGDRRSIEAVVQRVEHCTGERHTVMRLEHGRRVGRHHGHRAAGPDTQALQRRRETSAALVELGVAVADGAVHDGGALGINAGRALEKGERRQGRVVRRIPVQALGEGRGWWMRHALECGPRHDSASRCPSTPRALGSRSAPSPMPRQAERLTARRRLARVAGYRFKGGRHVSRILDRAHR